MYVWQMNDGRWHISMYRTAKGRARGDAMLNNPEARSLYYSGYDTEALARAAVAQICSLIVGVLK